MVTVTPLIISEPDRAAQFQHHCKPILCNENRSSLFLGSPIENLCYYLGILIFIAGKPVMKTGFPSLSPVLSCTGL